VVRLRRVGDALGAEIRGLDLRRLDDLSLATLYEAVLEHEVVFLRAQDLDDEAQLRLARQLGEPLLSPLLEVLGETEPAVVEAPAAPHDWHDDLSWCLAPPKLGLARPELRAVCGGDTLWASMTAAYAALSPPLRALLEELRIHHDPGAFIEALPGGPGPGRARSAAERLRAARPGVEHPAIRTHSETGRRALCFGGAGMRRVVDVEPHESAAILDLLRHHVDRPELHCQWTWQPGDVAIWDARSTIHRDASGHSAERCRLRRIDVDGERPYLDACPAPDPLLYLEAA
jgi:taurine dioxygenase